MISIKHKFLASVVIDGSLVPNSWDLTVNLTANTDYSNYDITTAIERINVWIEALLDNSMLVGPEDMEMLKSAAVLPFSISVHPLIDEPYDHILGISIYTKISAILEKRLFVDSLYLESYQGGNISHSHTAEDGDIEILRSAVDPGQEEYAEFWYRKVPVFFSVDHEGINLVEQTWDDLELGFNKDKADKNIVKLPGFTPRIIPGDKDD